MDLQKKAHQHEGAAKAGAHIARNDCRCEPHRGNAHARCSMSACSQSCTFCMLLYLECLRLQFTVRMLLGAQHPKRIAVVCYNFRRACQCFDLQYARHSGSYRSWPLQFFQKVCPHIFIFFVQVPTNRECAGRNHRL